jgi:hypothetical protein
MLMVEAEDRQGAGKKRAGVGARFDVGDRLRQDNRKLECASSATAFGKARTDAMQNKELMSADDC